MITERTEVRGRRLPEGSGMQEFKIAFQNRSLQGGDIVDYETVARNGKVQKKKGIFGYAYIDENREIAGFAFFPANLQPVLRHEDAIGRFKVTGQIPEKIFNTLFYEAIVDKAIPMTLPAKPLL